MKYGEVNLTATFVSIMDFLLINSDIYMAYAHTAHKRSGHVSYSQLEVEI